MSTSLAESRNHDLRVIRAPSQSPESFCSELLLSCRHTASTPASPHFAEAAILPLLSAYMNSAWAAERGVIGVALVVTFLPACQCELDRFQFC